MGVLNYFNLNRTEVGKKKDVTSRDIMPIKYQIMMYIGIVLGVVISLIFGQVENGAFNPNIDLSNILFKIILSFFIGAIITPYVYRKVNPDRNSPILIQFFTFFQFGFFWNVIFVNIASVI
jgi:hypothetical protein